MVTLICACIYATFFGRFDMAYLNYIFKIEATLHQETCQLQHGVSKTMMLMMDLNYRLSTRFPQSLTNLLETVNAYKVINFQAYIETIAIVQLILNLFHYHYTIYSFLKEVETRKIFLISTKSDT